jgi:hypothetical protein
VVVYFTAQKIALSADSSAAARAIGYVHQRAAVVAPRARPGALPLKGLDAYLAAALRESGQEKQVTVRVMTGEGAL